MRIWFIENQSPLENTLIIAFLVDVQFPWSQVSCCMSIYNTFQLSCLQCFPVLLDAHIPIVLLPNIQYMRIFISSFDGSGSKRTTRLTLSNCTNTSQVLKQITKLLGSSRKTLIIKLKYQPYNLRIVQGWPISHYPIRNGSSFTVELLENLLGTPTSSSQLLDKIHEDAEDDAISDDSSAKLSFISENGQHDESKYLDECLEQMLEAVRQNSLDQIAILLKAEPELDDEKQVGRIMARKGQYLINQIGQCGRNALHWAIHNRSTEIITFLMIKGTDPKLLTIDQYSPLQLAVLHRSPQIIAILLQQNKINVNQITSKGTALHLAVFNEDMRCVELLLQNGADPQIKNLQDKNSIAICVDQKIKALLRQKARSSRIIIPNITKGSVQKVSSFSRLKQRMLTVNPFRNQISISSQSQVQMKLALAQITGIEQLTEKSWLMKSNLFYFKLQIAGSDITFALKHQQMCLKWIQTIKNSYRFVLNAKFNRAVPPQEQIIEMIDDEKNQIKLHKRKVEQSAGFRNTISIMSLKMSKQQSQQEQICQDLKGAKLEQKAENASKQSRQTQSPTEQNNCFRDSEILLGSVLEEKSALFSSPSTKPDYRGSAHFKAAETEDDSIRQKSQTVSSTSFRKNSESRIQIVSQFKAEEKHKVSFNDFQITRLLGNGAFGKVYLARLKSNGLIFALKVLNKKKLIAKKQLKYAVSEANILKKVDSPFIIKLYYAFQTPTNLYMALDNCTNGDLSELINVKQRISLSTSRFIIAQIILAVEYLHLNKVLYRDLKPQNVLIAKDGYVRLTDFGLSKENNFSTSFCGSPAYLSPEMLEKKGVGFSTDIYGIGCILYQMLIGEPPYFDQNIDTLYENIKNGRLRFPDHITKQARSLVNKLLERDIMKRIGIKDIKQIKQHQFFKGFDWGKIERKALQPPPQMFLNQQESYDEFVKLQKHEKGQSLQDSDYQQTSSMMNRIKNFTFAREETVVLPIAHFELQPVKT